MLLSKRCAVLVIFSFLMTSANAGPLNDGLKRKEWHDVNDAALGGLLIESKPRFLQEPGKQKWEDLNSITQAPPVQKVFPSSKPWDPKYYAHSSPKDELMTIENAMNKSLYR